MSARKRAVAKAKPKEKPKPRSITLRADDGHWEMLQDIQHELGKRLGKQQSSNSTLLNMIEAEHARRFPRAAAAR